MLIHWAGEGSNVIIALARDPSPTPTSNSSLYISNDYGKSFTLKNLYLGSGSRGAVYTYYISPVYNTHVRSLVNILVDNYSEDEFLFFNN